jgi:hypothetical protein
MRNGGNPVDNDVKQLKQYNGWTKSHPHGLLISFHQIHFSSVHKHLLESLYPLSADKQSGIPIVCCDTKLDKYVEEQTLQTFAGPKCD